MTNEVPYTSAVVADDVSNITFSIVTSLSAILISFLRVLIIFLPSLIAVLGVLVVFELIFVDFLVETNGISLSLYVEGCLYIFDL